MLDRKALDALQAMIGGSRADLAELVGDFLAEAPSQFAVLADPDADAAAIRRAAHTLKSNLRDLGALVLANLCAALERDLAGGADPATARPQAEAILAQWPAVRAALQAEMAD